MKTPEHAPGTAARLDELVIEGARLWVARRARINQSMVLMIGAVILFVVAQLFGAMITRMLSVPQIHPTDASTWLINATFIGPALIFLAGFVLLLDSLLRLRFMVESVDLEMRRLDPEARLLSSGPEVLGRAIRAALDERRS